MKEGKVTTDFNGKMILQKEAVSNYKLINVGVAIDSTTSQGGRASSMSRRSIKSSRLGSQISKRFDPKKGLVAQFNDNLEAIY